MSSAFAVLSVAPRAACNAHAAQALVPGETTFASIGSAEVPSLRLHPSCTHVRIVQRMRTAAQTHGSLERVQTVA